jgi:hypothetical protein
MRARILVVVAVALFGSVACAASAATNDASSPSTGPDELVYLATAQGPSALDMRDGRIAFRSEGAVPQGDWSALFSTTASAEGDGTVLHTIDPATGNEVASAPLPGSLAIRVVAADGSKVALMAPPPTGQDPWTPVPRTETTIVVADPTGATEPERLRLEGNLEPEAFSADGEHLFVIQYLPPEAPSLYRVAAVELDEAEVYPVPGRDKTWAQRMPGTRLEQLLAPDQSQLYTLYSSQPAAYAEGFDDTQASANGPIAFVHMLDLEDGWAFCLPLPRPMWDAPAGEQAIAASVDAERLYVVDPSRGVVAVVAPAKAKVIETGTVDFGTDDAAHAAAAVSPDGSLYVGTGEAVVALDAETLQIRFRWPTTEAVRSLAASVDGSVLYVALGDRIDVLDPATGTVQDTVPVEGALSIAHVAPAA